MLSISLETTVTFQFRTHFDLEKWIEKAKKKRVSVQKKGPLSRWGVMSINWHVQCI